MTPTYELRVWQEGDWWLARVVGASEGADPSPLNALTQARSLARIGDVGRDLVATILDADDDAFEMDLEYTVPGEAGDVVGQARSARVWLDAAQQLWQERATLAARTLAGQGYSLREIAVLRGLSHQRVDQLLGGYADDKQAYTLVVHSPAYGNSGNDQREPVAARDVDALLVIRGLGAQDPATTFSGSEMEAQLREQATQFLQNLTSRMSPDPDAAGFDNARAV